MLAEREEKGRLMEEKQALGARLMKIKDAGTVRTFRERSRVCNVWMYERTHLGSAGGGETGSGCVANEDQRRVG